jgi:hypothetical protein
MLKVASPASEVRLTNWRRVECVVLIKGGADRAAFSPLDGAAI